MMSGRDTSHEPRREPRPESHRRIGGYEIIDTIGKGGMGMVYLARHTGLRRLDALKELSDYDEGDPKEMLRFLREARLAGSLNHPNVVTIFDGFAWEGRPYIAMEYVRGGDLRPLIGHMTFPQIAGALEALFSGLAHAEKHGIVHRDLKPANLLVTDEGHLKIADFGIAKAIDATSTWVTTQGRGLGTAAYMAPEQAMDEEVGPWTDLYSSGIIAFEMISGDVPFGGRRDVGVLFNHATERPEPPVPISSDVPPEVCDWVVRLLEPVPAERPQSASETWEELEEIVLATLGARWKRDARLTPAISESIEAAAKALEDLPAWPDPWREQREKTGVEPVQAEVTSDKRRDQPARRWRRTAVIGALAACAAVLGVVTASRSDEPRRQPSAKTAATSDFQLTFGDPWRSSPRDATSLGIDDGVTLVKGTGDQLTLDAGPTTASGPSLVPAEIARRLVRAAGGGERVRLGAYEAVRHRGLQLRGRPGAITLFGIPTSSGVLTIACTFQDGSDSLARDCDDVAGTVRLKRGTPYPVGPRSQYGAAINAVLHTLGPARSHAIDALRTSKKPSQQAKATAAAWQAYRTAYGRLARLRPSPVDALAHRDIVKAAARAADGYQRMKRAADAERPRKFDAARRLALSGEAAFGDAIDSLESLGYEVGS